jgi:bacillithiol system protein YtxJ
MAEIERLETVEALDDLLSNAGGRRVWIFKHSLVCPISNRAFGEYQRFVETGEDGSGVVYALVEIQNARPVSAAVAERTGVRHESPQALLLEGGRVVWHDSHWNITERSLAAAG